MTTEFTQQHRRPAPRVVVAGTSSGAGKTSVTLALVSALRRRGLKVQTFKVGPDYLDPSYLTIASGRPCYNLDGWMTNEGYVRSLFTEKAAGADISVIEGVMGLFDGSDPVGRQGSTAEIAAWLDAPVLLVVDVHGMARSIAAVVKGFSELDPAVRVAGVVANHCGSERHGEWLAESLSSFGLPPLVASIPRGSFPGLPSRHLGLVTADSRNLSGETLAMLADTVERYGNVSEVLEIAADSPAIELSVTPERTALSNRIRLGLAYDEAFHFYYPDNLEALEAAGCDLVRFSPVHDDGLPEALDGVYLGGGYPEEHARALSENEGMRDAIKRFSESSRPLYAECGGLMYLCEGIETLDGTRFAMVGLLPQWTRMLPRLKSLGYAQVTLADDSLMGKQGAELRGHEFHYSELLGDPTGHGDWHAVYRLQYRRSDRVVVEGFQRGNTLATYIHAHFACRPRAVEHFVAACVASRCGGPEVV